MDGSILLTIKKMLGIEDEYTQFDMDLIVFINGVFSILYQLGVGSDAGFAISDNTAKWSDYLSDYSNLETIKTYIYLKVRLLFDPPTSSNHVEAINRQISELEWRINVQVDPKQEENDV